LFVDGARRVAPALVDAPVLKTWVGLRTLTPDEAFVIGEDPSVAGLFWMAGLGGRGISCGLAAGRLAAEILLGVTRPVPAMEPGRFSR
jgi:D-arginine dehydrogenase